MHEVCYDFNSHLSATINDFLIDLFKRSPSISPSDILTLSKEFRISNQISSLEEIIVSLFSNPSFNINFFTNFSVRNNLSISIDDNFFAVAFIEMIYQSITKDEDLLFASSKILTYNSFSYNFWSIIEGETEIIYQIFKVRNEIPNYALNKKLILKFLGEESYGIEYLLTRSIVNAPFDLNDLILILNSNLEIENMNFLMTEFLYTISPTLLELEIFSQIVDAKLFPIELVPSACNRIDKSDQLRKILLASPHYSSHVIS